MPCGPLSASDALTRQFNAWEIRGRGWQVWNAPVSLEPPFRPFLGHFIPSPTGTSIDDGRRSTILSSLFERFAARGKISPPPSDFEESEPEPLYLEDDSPIIEIQATLPADTKTGKEAAGQFLSNLGHVSRPVSFELVGTRSAVIVQVACAGPDRRQVREQLQAYFPEVILTERDTYLGAIWDDDGNRETAVVDFGLSKEFMRPLRSFDRFDPDPLCGIIGAMSELGMGEVAVLQVLFTPVRHPWPESIMRAVTNSEGESFFADDPALPKLASEKIASPLYATILRVAAQSRWDKRAWRIALGIGKSLRQFADPASNELIALTNEGYGDRQHARDVVARRSCRSGMLLNGNELLSIAHLPSASARSTKLKREERRTKAAPVAAIGHHLVLGENYHSGKTTTVTLSPEQRVRHMHCIGASGSGKSTLLLSMIAQDMKNGDGLAVLDPHGDLIDQVLDRVPPERVGDVVLLDPSDEAFPVAFNILSVRTDTERNLLASDLVSVFRRLSTSFGDQMNTVLGNAIMAFLESSEGGTLADLRRFLVEIEYRQRVLQSVRDPDIIYYWQKEFPLLTGKPQGPILTRLDTFLRPKVIRYMMSQKADRLDFGGIMNGQKILLAKLSQGLIGEENSYLLGTLLVSKLNQVAMSRQSMAASERKPFYLYIDEFHNFVTPSMAAILTGARKYNLGLILAHQELQQISNRDGDVAGAVISNPYTRVCFRLGDFEAKKMADGFSFFGSRDLQNLGVGEAICRMEQSEQDFNLKTSPLPPVDQSAATQVKEQVISSSRERYGTKREEVEAVIAASRPAQTETIRIPIKAKRGSKPEAPDTPPSQQAPPPGRGGEHHKYLQDLIKRWAEPRGYEVTIEKPILDGLGWVDVALRKGETSIACEISVTTSPEHEVGNIQKCLAAGFEQVIFVSSEKNTLTAVKHVALGALSAGQYKQVRFLTPEQVFAFIESTEVKTAARPTAPDPSELLTAKDVEELLRIDVKTVYSYVQKGILPYVKMQSNVRFIRSEILKWMEERQYKPAGRSKR